jgi:lysozyme family protein
MFSLGRSMSVKWVQEACNRRMKMPGSVPLEVDGWAGTMTQFAMVRHSEGDLVADVIGARILKHARVVAATPSQSAFLVGWCNRAVKWLQK